MFWFGGLNHENVRTLKWREITALLDFVETMQKKGLGPNRGPGGVSVTDLRGPGRRGKRRRK
jgi:hypothetical protein